MSYIRKIVKFADNEATSKIDSIVAENKNSWSQDRLAGAFLDNLPPKITSNLMLSELGPKVWPWYAKIFLKILVVSRRFTSKLFGLKQGTND